MDWVAIATVLWLTGAPSVPTLQGTIRVQVTEWKSGEEDSGFKTWVVAGKERRELPPQSIYETTGELIDRSDTIPYRMECKISPDQNWIFATQKLWHTVSIAYLYHRRAGLDFQAAMPVRFDEAAWRYYARKHHLNRGAITQLGDGHRMIDFGSWSRDSSRVRFDIWSSGKKMDWSGWYDTRMGRFGAAP